MKFITKDIKNSYCELKKSSQEGILQYAYCSLDEGIIPAPASTAVHIAFIIDGAANYGDISVKPGDIIAYGINKEPMIARVKNISLFFVSMEFWLFYKITGIIPADCQEVILFSKKDPLYQLGQSLFERPVDEWIDYIDCFANTVLENNQYPDKSQITRVYHAAHFVEHQGLRYLNSILSDLEVSYRQLQRDFISILGISIKEYEEIARFHKAVDCLSEKNLVETAQHTGYWDQAHMAREFKKMMGMTPSEIRKNELFKKYEELENLFVENKKREMIL